MKTNFQPVQLETNPKSGLVAYECFPRPEWRALFPAIIAIALTAGIMAHLQIDWYWIVLPCVLLFFAGLSVCWWPVIEIQNRLVRERALLFKRKFLIERKMPFDEFEEIFCQLNENEGSREYWVGLRRRPKGILWVKDCGSQRRSAEEFGWQLHCETGIHLKGETLSKEQFFNDKEKFRK
ncbi:MAG: hypothetical protein WCH99_05920 [Verrucomicrobiota bacterium]